MKLIDETGETTPQSKITRVEVIDHTKTNTGRCFVKWNINIDLSVQDDGRTLKIFVTDKEKTNQSTQ